MSTEEFHKDLISRLDPETVAKALERYNRRHSTAGVRQDDGGGKSPCGTSRINDSQSSTPSIVTRSLRSVTPPR